MSGEAILIAIDQGTTSSRAMAFDPGGYVLARAGEAIAQHYPDDGWVEHEPADLWTSSLNSARRVLRELGAEADRVVAIGITNQRETTVVWDRATGEPIHRAIVWQDRRTAAQCDSLKARGKERLVRERTGLVIDPYFSATKIASLLDHVPGARARAEAGELAFGTVDSWLVWNLTKGKRHVTDATNAARTALFDIHRLKWDEGLCALFDVPTAILPEVVDCASEIGLAEPAWFGRPIPVRGMAGDQQAATVGQACFAPGMVKSTYGTGCFVLQNTGAAAVHSKNRLLTTLAYRMDGATTYAVEGSIFIAGAAVQWLRDGLGLVASAEQTEALAAGIPETGGVYMVPAFTGLGAPHWDATARGAIYGLTRDTGPAQIVRAALESVAYQTLDLFEALGEDGMHPASVRVDGGMVANSWFVQMLADILGLPVDRPVVDETTALGAAYLAGLQSGVWPDTDALSEAWRRDRRFTPRMQAARREALIAGWQDAVRRTLTPRG